MSGIVLKDWFGRFLAHHGALIAGGEDELEAVLTPEVAARAGWNEFERFTVDPRAGGRLLALHSDTIRALEPLVHETGAHAEVTLPLPTRSDGFEALAARRFCVENGVCRYGSRVTGTGRYLLAACRVTALSEERREALLHLAVNVQTGAVLDDLPRLLLGRLDEAADVAPIHRHGLDLSAHVPALEHAVLRAAPGLFAEFRRSLERRLHRDLTRLDEYYGSLEADLRSRRGRAVDPARMQDKIDAVRRERERKLADQRARYALSIRTAPVACLTVSMPAVHVSVEVRRRSLSREVALTWNSLLKDLEPVACEGCLDPVRKVHLCNARVHLLCASCHTCPVCGRERCKACDESCRQCSRAAGRES